GLGFRLTALASIVWCAAQFAPSLPDEYLKPAPFAASIWQKWPAIDNPLAEVFAERVSESEPSPRPPLATADCGKVLLIGEGAEAIWPASCADVEPPQFCTYAGALCYANRSGSSYQFARAPSSPAWLRDHLSPAPDSSEIPVSRYVLPPLGPPAPTL